MPLKPLEAYPSGGVDSRSNPVNMPVDRYLSVHDFWPQQDGSIRLRDGYTLLKAGVQAGVPIHSIISVVGPGPNYTPLVIFWQGTTPYTYNTSTKAISTPTVRGTTVTSAARFSYFYTNGKLYAYNGTDAKFFDGVVWRDIGLPTLSGTQLSSVIVSGSGLSAMTDAEAALVTVTANSGGSWVGDTNVFAYLAFFDTANDTLMTSKSPLGDGSPTLVTAGQKLDLAVLPTRTPTSVVALPGIAPVASRLLPKYVGLDPSGCIFLLSNAPGSTTAGTVVTCYYNSYPAYGPDPVLVAAVGAGTTKVQITASVSGGHNFAGIWEVTSVGTGMPAGHDTTHAYFTFDYPTSGSYEAQIAGSYYRQLEVTGDFGGASFLIDGASLTASAIAGADTTVTVTSAGHGLSTGDVICLYDGETGAPWRKSGPYAITVTGTGEFLFQSPDAPLFDGLTDISFFKLQTVPNAATTFTIDPNTLATGEGTSFNARGDNLLPYMNVDSTNGIVGSGIGGSQPGYQFYASIINTVTLHVGNRQPIGLRIANLSAAIFQIDNLPDVHALDSEWAILIGRTSDGAEIPYAIMDTNGDWLIVENGITSVVINQRNIDGNAELPSRNYPPPGTLDYNAQLAALPGGASKNPPITGTFARAWIEADHCCGTLEGSPTVYRSGSAQDMREGQFVGLPEQSWSPADIETFPTGQPVSCGQGYECESWVYSRHDSAVLLELAGETSWQGPWNIGAAGQYAWTRGWRNLPYWVTGTKQLATVSLGGYSQIGGTQSVEKSGPVVISQEYESGLLARIGDQYLGETEVCYIRIPRKMVDVLRIKCRDKDGCPFVIIHDFNLRDDRSPYGQGYDERLTGALTESCP